MKTPSDRWGAGSRTSAAGGRAGKSAALRLVQVLSSPQARVYALIGFVVMVALMGGGSRPDITSLMVLRPVSILFCAYAYLVLDRERLRDIRGPAAIVLSLMGLCLVQLIPLPASVWTALPGREPVLALANAFGIEGHAMPLSLDPGRTWNAFFALFVPLAMIGLVAGLPQARRALTVNLLLLVALVSAGFAFLQALGLDLLYLYRITNDANPVGLFANRNHQAVLLCWLVIGIGYHIAGIGKHRQSAGVILTVGLALIVLIVPLVILTGSRAGLGLLAPCVLVATWLASRSPLFAKADGRKISRRRWIALAAALVAIPAGLATVALFFSTRETAFSRLFEVGAAEEARWIYLPIFVQMAKDYFPFGSGFGSFADAFKGYEPGHTLSTRYMNQAHNDLIQIVIEGGVAALAILLGALAWCARLALSLLRSARPGAAVDALFVTATLAVWFAASIVDYPLRTPLVMMLLAGLAAHFAIERSAGRMNR